MEYIGNDIISLTCPFNKKSFNSTTYLKKVFTAYEISLFTCQNKSYLPLLLWSCKESAYKILMKKGFNNAFSPALFSSRIIIEESTQHIKTSIITYRDQEIFTISFIHNNFIHTYASDCKETLFKIKFKSDVTSEPDISGIMHSSLLYNISTQLNLPFSQFKILKNTNNIPSVMNIVNNNSFQVSMSHDEHYFSFAYLI